MNKSCTLVICLILWSQACTTANIKAWGSPPAVRKPATPTTASTSSMTPDQAQKLLKQVQILDSQKKYQGEADALSQLTKFQPENLSLHAQLGTTLYRLGKIPQAEIEFKAALKCSGDTSACIRNLAVMYVAQNRLTDAESVLKQSFKHDPNPSSADMHVQLADVEWKLNKQDASIAEYKKGLSFDPKNLEGLNNLMFAYAHTGQTDLAIKTCLQYLKWAPPGASTEAMKNSLKQLKAAGADSSHAVTSGDSPSADVQKLIAQAKQLTADKKYAESVKIWEQAEQLQPKSFALRRMHADTLIASGDNTAAERVLKEALEIEPGDFATLFNLAQLYRKDEKTDEALIYFKKAATIDISGMTGPIPAKTLSATLHADIGNCEDVLGHTDAAIEEYLSALKIDPREAEALNNLARIYEHSGRMADFIKTATTYTEYYPNDARTKIIKPLIAAAKQTNTVDDSASSDYFKAIATPALRWNTSRPLNVYIQKESSLPNFKSDYEKYFVEACDKWTQASKKLTWQQVADESKADLVCVWTDKIPDVPGMTNEQGRAGMLSKTDDKSTIDKGKIYILLTDLTNPGKPATDALIKFACLHEMGHGMGLHGHSSNAKDVMFFVSSPESPDDLSDRDKATVEKLYGAL